MNNKRICGFTLIEILVVMVIIGIIAGMAALAIGNRLEEQRWSNAVTRFLQTARYAQNLAILQQSPLGLNLQEGSYYYSRYDSTGSNHTPSHWQALNKDSILGNIKIPSDLRIEVTSPNTQEPRIIFSNDGTTTPFKIVFTPMKGKKQYIILGKLNNELELHITENP